MILMSMLGGCEVGDNDAAQGPRPIFGDGSTDATRVVARVNGEDITERMLDLRYEELNRQEKARFNGPEGRRLFLRKMVEEVLRVRDAEQHKFDLEPIVARVLIAQYRESMNMAHGVETTRDVEPTIDEVRTFFEENRDQYQRLGMMSASHVECSTKAQADIAYVDLTEKNRTLAWVVAEYSENNKSIVNGGDLGWFNKGGFTPAILNSKGFTEAIWDFKNGPNPPFEFEGKWHMVVVHDRNYGRPQTLDEAYERVVSDMMPGLHRSVTDAWLDEATAGAEIEYFAEFRPGHGKTPKELLERAYYANDPQLKVDILRMLVEDFPKDEYTDDALFMAANIYLDTWGDRRQASFYLLTLVRGFPESDYAADAQYIIDNMDKPGFTNPSSIEDLRQGQ